MLTFHYNKDLKKNTQSREKYLREQVIKIANEPQPEQRSPEWYLMRESMVTASDWGTILGENHYAKSESVLLKKCDPNAPFISNDAMKWGIKYEAVAVQIYEHRNKTKVLEFGCLRHPIYSFLGASPDGITEDGTMVEIKCPSSREITGEPPSYYWCQVQGQLEVCELDRCDFLECNIKEYIDESDYDNDNFYHTNGNEKGVVAEFFKISDKTFFFEYSPVGIIGNELTQWKGEMENKYSGNICFAAFSYWYLERVSCVPIYRNQEWFYKALPQLNDFWNKVLYYREVGLDKLKEDLQKVKDDKKMVREERREEKAKKEKEKPKRKKNETIILDADIRNFITVEKKPEIIINSTSSSDNDMEYDEDDKTVSSAKYSLFSNN